MKETFLKIQAEGLSAKKLAWFFKQSLNSVIKDKIKNKALLDKRSIAYDLSIFISKVLLEYSHTHFFNYCLWLPFSYKEWAK